MGAGVVGDVELPFDIENRDNYVSGLDPEGGASGNIIGFAEFEAGRHDVSVACLPAFRRVKFTLYRVPMGRS
jgi:hypothetical protein